MTYKGEGTPLKSCTRHLDILWLILSHMFLPQQCSVGPKTIRPKPPLCAVPMSMGQVGRASRHVVWAVLLRALRILDSQNLCSCRLPWDSGSHHIDNCQDVWVPAHGKMLLVSSLIDWQIS